MIDDGLQGQLILPQEVHNDDDHDQGVVKGWDDDDGDDRGIGGQEPH